MSPPLRQEPYDAHGAGCREHFDPTLARAAERLAELAGARRGTRLLDLATGTGTVARAAVRRGASDRSGSLGGMLAVARELSPETDLRLADARALPFDLDTFDAVTCGLSLSHFADRENALREVLRVLQRLGATRPDRSRAVLLRRPQGSRRLGLSWRFVFNFYFATKPASS